MDIVDIENMMLDIHVFVYASHFLVEYHDSTVLCKSCS